MFGDSDAMIVNKLKNILTKITDIGTSIGLVRSDISSVATKDDMQSVKVTMKLNKQYNPNEHISYNQYPFYNIYDNGDYCYSIGVMAVDTQYLYLSNANKTLYIYNKNNGQLVASLTTTNSCFSRTQYNYNDDYIWFWDRGIVVISKSTLSIKCEISVSSSQRTYNAWVDGNYVYMFNGDSKYIYKYDLNTGSLVKSLQTNIYSITSVQYRSILVGQNVIVFPYDKNYGLTKCFNVNTMTISTTTLPTIYAPSGCSYVNNKLIVTDKNNIHIYNANFKYESTICLSHGCEETLEITALYNDADYLYCKTTNKLFVYNLSDFSFVGFYYFENMETACRIVCDGVYVYIHNGTIQAPLVYVDKLITFDQEVI